MNPHDVGFFAPDSIERQVLGFLLCDASRTTELMDFWLEKLHVRHFTRPDRQALLELIKDMRDQGKHVSGNIVEVAIRHTDNPDNYPSAGDLFHLFANEAQIPQAMETSLKILDEARRDREARDTLRRGYQSILDGEDPTETLSATVEGLELSRSGWANHESTPWQAMSKMVESDETGRHYMGLAALDRLLGPLKPANIWVLQAHTGDGKTMVACHVGRSVVHAEGRVMHVQTEGTDDETMERYISGESHTTTHEVREWMNDRPVDRRSAKDIEEAYILWTAFSGDSDRGEPPRLVILSRAGIRASEIARRARIHHDREPLDLLVVDYVQRLRAEDADLGRKRHEQVAASCQLLTNLAVELRIPVLIIAQPKASWLDAGRGKEPRLYPLEHHLGESSQLGRDADAVISFAYPSRRHSNDEYKGRAVIAVVKRRHGPRGRVWVRYAPRYCELSDLDQRDWPTTKDAS